jgi:sulfite exporter TauE/SafE/copper chaperone CopZ
MRSKHYQLSISGMQCVDCENNIEEAVAVLPGVTNANADFVRETLMLDLDEDAISLKTVCAAVKARGYRCGNFKGKKPAGFAKRLALSTLVAAGIILLFQLNKWVQIDISLDEIDENASLGLIFLVGILTSFHCIGMCGGFVLSYAAGGGAKSSWLSYQTHISYGIGKTVSYASIGALFGFIGGAVSFTLGMRSLAMALAGAFLMIYGLSLLDAFAGLRRFHIRLPRFLIHSLSEKRRRLSNPLAIGLLNGLMIACGPLQAMYIMAAGTGSPLHGAALLAVFALGTLPVMFIFGLLSGLITANATRHFLKISGFIILLLGVIMLNRSLLLLGTGYDVNSLWSKASQRTTLFLAGWSKYDYENPFHLQEGYQVIYTEAEKFEYIPGRYRLKTNVPVKWIINVKELSPCNKRIIVPDLNLTIDLKEGVQMVKFLPKKAGTISWSCSMGMIPGVFIVTD